MNFLRMRLTSGWRHVVSREGSGTGLAFYKAQEAAQQWLPSEYHHHGCGRCCRQGDCSLPEGAWQGEVASEIPWGYWAEIVLRVAGSAEEEDM